ncbi:hypothetical protein A2U01_0115065, partial [Trifolium medium]|nr:hypothetical protein [Trifolium medium]
MGHILARSLRASYVHAELFLIVLRWLLIV